tara:strand:- start:394 stop:1395 length:1002 start_codon:yes stop_codon:yes gene_type:complete
LLIGISPLRIGFAGGGTDLEEYHEKYVGQTISATINKFTYVFARLRSDNKLQSLSPDFASYLPPKTYSKIALEQGHEIILSCLKEMKFSKGIDIFFCSDVSPGSGLGASGAMTCNIVEVLLKLQNKKLSKKTIALKAYGIGHDVLKWKIGKQDEFGATFGGFNLCTWNKKKVNVKQLSLNKNFLKELGQNSMLFNVGFRGHSSKLLGKQVANIKKSSKGPLEALHRQKEIALEITDALKRKDLTGFTELIKEGWEQKKNYANGITNKNIENISKIAFSNGASALKVTGAGGGGHMYLIAKPSRHKTIEKSLQKIGVKKVPFSFTDQGTRQIEL